MGLGDLPALELEALELEALELVALELVALELELVAVEARAAAGWPLAVAPRALGLPAREVGTRGRADKPD